MSTLVLITDFMHGGLLPFSIIGPIILLLSVWLFVTRTTKYSRTAERTEKKSMKVLLYHYSVSLLSTKGNVEQKNELRRHSRYVTD